MNGRRLLLDTNAVVALLQGNQRLIEYTQAADWIGISIVTRIEFVCFSQLVAADRQLFEQFISQIEVIGLHPGDQILIDRIVQIRQSSRTKLPDAIVAATAICRGAALVSADRQLASIENL